MTLELHKKMSRVRCTSCRALLAVPQGVPTISCPLCHATVVCTRKNNFRVARPTPTPTPVQNNVYANRVPNHVYRPRPLPTQVQGRKRALLIGISYNGQKNSVKGSVNDVKLMNNFLGNKMGFPRESILVLTEEEMDPYRTPTRSNIQWALRWLVQGCQSGDSLVFFYSGHGSQVRDVDGDEFDGYDEALCPVDYLTEGKILDDEINATIVRPLPKGVKLHAIVDTCKSGTFMDLPFLSRMDQQGYYKWEDHRIQTIYKGTSGGTAICFSACDDHETSLDTTAFIKDTVTGAMTCSFIQALENERGLTYGLFLQSIRTKICEAQKRLYGSHAPITPQVPHLSSSETIDIYSKPFML